MENTSLGEKRDNEWLHIKLSKFEREWHSVEILGEISA